MKASSATKSTVSGNFPRTLWQTTRATALAGILSFWFFLSYSPGACAQRHSQPAPPPTQNSPQTKAIQNPPEKTEPPLPVGPLAGTGPSLPLTSYRLNLLTIRDVPAQLTDERLGRFTGEQVGAEGSQWKELPAVAMLRSRNLKRTIIPVSYVWQSLLSQQPTFANGGLLDVFLRPDADWSFVKNPNDSVVMAFIFDKDKVVGRDQEFAAHDLLPVSRKFLTVAASKTTTNLWVARDVTWKYDFATKSVRLGDMPGGFDILKPMYDPTARDQDAYGKEYFSNLSYRPRQTAVVWVGSLQGEAPEKKAGQQSGSPEQYWRDKFSFLSLPPVLILGLDRMPRLSSFTLAPAEAEALKITTGAQLVARLYFVADHVEEIHPKGQPPTGMPQLILYARIQKVEIWTTKNTLVTTLGPEKFMTARQMHGENAAATQK